MNERIRELMAEADRKCSETRGIYDEILAELIVRECIDIVDKVYDDQTGMGAKMCRRATPYQEIINEIEEHFGVE
jgi:hypothetical protein